MANFERDFQLWQIFEALLKHFKRTAEMLRDINTNTEVSVEYCEGLD